MSARLKFERKVLGTFSNKFLLALIIFEFTRLAFPPKVRKEVKADSQGYCQDCGVYVGKEKIIAAHLIHGDEPGLQVKSNAVARCLYCEARYHLQFSGSPSEIGLSRKDNNASVYGHVMALSDEERKILTQEYSGLWERVLSRIDR